MVVEARKGIFRRNVLQSFSSVREERGNPGKAAHCVLIKHFHSFNSAVARLSFFNCPRLKALLAEWGFARRVPKTMPTPCRHPHLFATLCLSCLPMVLFNFEITMQMEGSALFFFFAFSLKLSANNKRLHLSTKSLLYHFDDFIKKPPLPPPPIGRGNKLKVYNLCRQFVY